MRKRPPPLRPEEEDPRWLLALLAGERLEHMAELGFGSGRRAELLLKSCAPEAIYHGFEADPSLLSEGKRLLRSWPLRAQLGTAEPAGGLPLPCSSQNLFVCAGTFERLRMDELYMTCHEARRILRPGGLWVVRGISSRPGVAGRWLARLGSWAGRRPLEILHYVSPEDWETLVDRKEPWGLFAMQTVLLRRLGLAGG